MLSTHPSGAEYTHFPASILSSGAEYTPNRTAPLRIYLHTLRLLLPITYHSTEQLIRPKKMQKGLHFQPASYTYRNSSFHVLFTRFLPVLPNADTYLPVTEHAQEPRERNDESDLPIVATSVLHFAQYSHRNTTQRNTTFLPTATRCTFLGYCVTCNFYTCRGGVAQSQRYQQSNLVATVTSTSLRNRREVRIPCHKRWSQH